MKFPVSMKKETTPHKAITPKAFGIEQKKTTDYSDFHRLFKINSSICVNLSNLW